MPELGNFYFKINVISDVSKNMSFKINNKLTFIDSFQFLSSSLDGLVRNLDSKDFKYLREECDCKVLDFAKLLGFYSYEYMSGFENFK